jgi:hypothetical protein
MAKKPAPVAPQPYKPRPMDQGLEDLLSANPVYQAHAILKHRATQVITGRLKFLIGYGPPGIAKSQTINQLLAAVTEIERQKWDAHAIPKPQRRTIHDPETGEDRFRPPYVLVQAGISFPVFFCRLFRTSRRGEIMFVDDVISLSDGRIQGMIQQATDPTHDGYCAYNYRAKLPYPDVPNEFHYHGGLIILTNFNRDEAHRKDSFKHLFNEAVLSRAEEVHFPFDRGPLLEYILIEAIKKRGLMGFLRAPRGAGLEDAADGDMHQKDEGLGFRGSDDEACAMIDEVGAFLLQNAARVERIEFRVARKLLRDRVFSPQSWRLLADKDILRPHTIDKGFDPSSPQWAFLERPTS